MGRRFMKRLYTTHWLRIAVPGAVLLQFGGCLGPNPGFFVSTSAANASIMFFVQQFWRGLIGAGG